MCGGGGKPPAAYTPSWQQGADNTLQTNLQGQSSNANQIANWSIPQLQTQASNAINDPNAASAMSTAGAASSMGMAAGQQQMDASQGLYNLAGSLPGMSQQIYQTAFDPQGALYTQQLQQSQDAQNAMASMYGVASGPYGAGLASQNNNNFNLAWGNNQLSRMTQGAGAIGGLDALSGALTGQAAGLQNGGLNTYTAAGMLPYQTSQGIYGNNLATLGGYASAAGAAMAPGFAADSGLAQYLGLGQSATQINDARREYLNEQNAQTMQSLGSLFGGQNFGGMFGGGGSGGAGGGGMDFFSHIFGGGGGAGGTAQLAPELAQYASMLAI